MFHFGHIQLLKKCEEVAFSLKQNSLGHPVRLLIGIYNDNDCIKYKHKPIMTMNERAMSIIELFELLGMRDIFVGILIDAPIVETRDFYDSEDIVKVLHARKEEEYIQTYYKEANEMGILRQLDYTEGISTSLLIERCIESMYEKI